MKGIGDPEQESGLWVEWRALREESKIKNVVLGPVLCHCRLCYHLHPWLPKRVVIESQIFQI